MVNTWGPSTLSIVKTPSKSDQIWRKIKVEEEQEQEE